MGALQTLDPTTSAPASAVVWLNGRHAIVAAIRGDEPVSQVTVNRGADTELEYLAAVVRAIGDRERVMILGPNQVRLDLEREYVSIYRRPERLVDVEPADLLDADTLVERVRRLAS